MTIKTVNSFQGPHRFLSNFYPSRIVSPYTGIVYPTAEHAFQAAKTLDLKKRRYCARLRAPGDAKRYGGLVALRPDWPEVRIPVMRTIVRAKFNQNLDLADLLMELHGYYLIEGNSWGDTFWGMCGGVGENNLGLLLMLECQRFLNCKDKIHKRRSRKT